MYKISSLKTIRRVLFYFFLVVAILLTSLVLSAFLFKDRIINQFIREANKNLNTPVKVGKIEVSVFHDFPLISILLKDVYIEDSHPGVYPLLTADEIAFQMNPIEVWQGIYVIQGLTISGSEANLKMNAQGVGNFLVVKEAENQSAGEAVKFQLKDVKLNNTTVHYSDILNRQDFIFSSSLLSASIASESDKYQIIASGELNCNKLLIDGLSYLSDKKFIIDSDLLYDDKERLLSINSSTLQLKTAEFAVTGSYSWKTRNLIDLTTKGKNTDIQTLLSLLPGTVSEKLAKYQSEGDVYFNAKIKGEMSKRKDPAVTVDFGFNDATIYHPDYKSRIEHAAMSGSFASPDVSNMRMATLVLKNIKGRLNNEDFNGNLVVANFENPEVIFDFKGKLDAASVVNFYPVKEINNITGSLIADLSFEGKIELLKDKATAQRVSTLGTIDLQDISLLYGKDKIPVENLRGSLQFNNNDLALSNVGGKLGKSDFLLNGFFKNIITFVLFEDQPIGIETDLKSNHIDLNEIFNFAYGEENTDQEYTFSISRNVNLNFNCDIASLTYKKFNARNVIGDLLVKNEVAVSRRLSCKSMGGTLELSGIVDAKNQKAIDVVSTLKVDGINIDSAFYVFDNFQQDFIEQRHLRGKAIADVNLEMTLDQHLKLFHETLIADIGITIKNGELNNFEPMKKLSRYVDDEGLSKLRFSDLKNDIHIENKKIYIPEMDIRSNVTDLKVSGTHTFDQLIDYRVVTPLKRKKIVDVDAQSAIEETTSGPKLFLKIVGTTDNYKVAYDTEAVRKKIGNDIKKEVKELKDAFKSKGKKKEKEIELEEDEYFDW